MLSRVTCQEVVLLEFGTHKIFHSLIYMTVEIRRRYYFYNPDIVSRQMQNTSEKLTLLRADRAYALALLLYGMCASPTLANQHLPLRHRR
jgi:hypothetical protein